MSFEIRETPGKGFGVFSKKKFFPGDVILSDRPSITTQGVVDSSSSKGDNDAWEATLAAFLKQKVASCDPEVTEREPRVERGDWGGRGQGDDEHWAGEGDLYLLPQQLRVSRKDRCREEGGDQRAVRVWVQVGDNWKVYEMKVLVVTCEIYWIPVIFCCTHSVIEDWSCGCKFVFNF